MYRHISMLVFYIYIYITNTDLGYIHSKQRNKGAQGVGAE